MIYYVNINAARGGDGTKDNPFLTISEAARLAQPGDEVIVAPGVYREHVDPANAGTADKRIVYRSELKLGAVITGAEPVKNWTRYQGSVWSVRISNGLFGSYNPYTTVIEGDWYHSVVPAHTGEVYLNGKSLYEASSLNEVLKGEKYLASWDPDFTVYKWYAEQNDGCTVLYANFHDYDPNDEEVEINVRRNCFYPTKEGVGYITLSGFVVKQAATTWAPPTAYQEGMVGPHWSKGWIIEDCEISDSKCSGISLGKYLQPNNDNKWMKTRVKDGTQTERDAICQAQTEGWSKENIGSHIIRRCNIHDCGQTGIVGHLGCVFSVIEDNHIHHINNKQNLAGAEIGGIKMHAAIDVTIRRNHIHNCTRGLWLDWQAQGTRVTANLFHNNVPPAGVHINDGLSFGEDIFVEVSHGPTLIDNNLLLSACSCRISTQGIALVHNLIAGSFTFVGNGTDNGAVNYPSPRYTPYHIPHRTEVAGFMTILHGDARFYNNIFIQQEISSGHKNYAEENNMYKLDVLNLICGTKPYDGYPTESQYLAMFEPERLFASYNRDAYYSHLPVYTGGNAYFNGAQHCDTEQNYYVDNKYRIYIRLINKNGKYRMETNLYDYLPKYDTPFISTELLGEAFEPEQKFENPDGTPIVFDTDYFGRRRDTSPLPGPFAHGDEAALRLW